LLAAAGRRADARGDAAASRSLLERATELLPQDDPELPSLLELLGSTTFEAGDARRALEILSRAQWAASAAGQRNIELRARMDELRVLIMGDPGQQTAAILTEAEAAIEELQQLDDAESLARAWYVVSFATSMRAHYALVAESEERRLELALRAGLRRDALSATQWLAGSLAVGPTPVEETIRRVEQALAEFEDESPGEVYLALLYSFAGRHDEAQETIERSRRALLELGQRTIHAGMSMNAGWIALLADEPARSEQDLREGADVLEAAGETGFLSTVAATLAEVLYRLGGDEEAEEWTRRSEQASSPEDVLSQALWRSTRAKVLARRGKAEESLRLSAEAVEWAQRSDGLPFIGDCLAARAEVLQMLGRLEEARQVLEEALAVYERKGIAPSIERTLALLAEIPV
jgi:tetratricopeptide (TPR) repeat protein